MSERVLPGVGLKGFDDYQADNWNAWADQNWLVISALMQGRVLSAVTTLPGSPATGAIYIVPSGTHANAIAVWDASTWTYITPQSGWKMFAVDTGLSYIFTGSAWVTTHSFGNVVLKPGPTVTPAANGDVTFELTNNAALTIKVKGSDGTVRSAVLTLT